MVNIKAIGSLTGYISSERTLSGNLSLAKESLTGKLSCVGCLQGKLTTSFDHVIYDGAYDVVPLANDIQVLNTANRLMTNNVIVTEIPFYETTNPMGGTTAYIAREV